MTLTDLACLAFGLSRGAARRLILSGGFYLSDIRFTNPDARLWWEP